MKFWPVVRPVNCYTNEYGLTAERTRGFGLHACWAQTIRIGAAETDAFRQCDAAAKVTFGRLGLQFAMHFVESQIAG
jgi:hypothetical protein